MHKRIFLILCAGFAISYLSAGARTSQSRQTSADGSAAAPKQTHTRNVTYELGPMGELRDEDGVHLGFTNFVPSDGSALIMVQYEDFGSVGAAQAFLDKQLFKAAKVIERERKLNDEGKVVGERAQILVRLDGQQSQPAVLWTDGIKFHEIISSSLKSILRFEKWYRY